jgi:hypothetical protein
MKRSPIRIQLQRSRGWRMPSHTVKVDRSTLWGNPYDVNEYGRELALHLFDDTARGCWSPANVRELDEPTAWMLHHAHHAWIRRLGGDPVARARRELRGRNLACWCALGHAPDDDCHAAILLRIANG